MFVLKEIGLFVFFVRRRCWDCREEENFVWVGVNLVVFFVEILFRICRCNICEIWVMDFREIKLFFLSMWFWLCFEVFVFLGFDECVMV